MGSLPPLVEPGPPLSADARARGSRQLLLPGFGELAQRRLAAARVLVIGAGGLGSPVLSYLAGAGIGTLGIVDSDTVDISNLHRQIIHRTADVGEPKTSSASRAIAASSPLTTVVQHPVRLDRHNALTVMSGYDLVVDGSDNFATRYLVSDAAALLRLPHVWGSVLRFDGQVAVFWEGAPPARALDYRDLHPVPPAPGDVLSCDEAGVLGSVCAVIGAMMATEAIKLVTGTGEPLLGRVATFDGLDASWRELAVTRAPDRRPVTGLIDYDLFCGAADGPEGGIGSGHGEPDAATIGPADLRAALLDPAARLVDVREPDEHAQDHLDGDLLLPLEELLRDPVRLGDPGGNRDPGGFRGAAGSDAGGALIVYCATGRRSARAVQVLREAGIPAVSLAGGIRAFREAEAAAAL
ncbi:MAG: hypothetical protein RI885_558 [Actinomycetota bacterium]|jgi:adenylyltransferase/sulfurtransferase